ncbi:MAG: prolipoprotein diacylglyceryl transferase [Patescibacteria group bacterium]|nr:prolipoprotein diacylglyceryl transferase [Patescibacteria group bacterium]
MFAFSGRLVLPQYFFLGPLEIHYYGITMAAAVAAAFYLAISRAEKYGIGKNQAEDLLLWLVIGGFLGARLYHVFSDLPYYWQHPIQIFQVWKGGLSIYGALIGGIAVLLVLRKIFNLKFKISNLLDWLAPSLLLGQIIGRLGNFFNYEAFGYPTNLPWKMFVPAAFRPENYGNFSYFHPWFLYEITGNILILAYLLKFQKKTRPGGLFFSYLLLYNMLRFFLEFLRIDSTFLGPLRLNVLSSLLLCVIAALGLLYGRRQANVNAKIP